MQDIKKIYVGVDTEWIQVAGNGQTEKIRALLEAGADAYAEDNDGKTALM